jgi:hypothetical protein
MKLRSLCAASLLASSLAFGVSGPAAAQEIQLFAVLSGGNEVSAGGAADAGDPNGHGVAAITFRGAAPQNIICMVVIVDKIGAPTAMHIHNNVAGQNGGIFQEFDPPTTGNGGTSGQCVLLPPAKAAAIKRNPAGFYVNVHTVAFPSGAVRGQLF